MNAYAYAQEQEGQRYSEVRTALLWMLENAPIRHFAVLAAECGYTQRDIENMLSTYEVKQ